MYARANLHPRRGGRFIQVAVSRGNDPSGPFGPFALINIAGYEGIADGNIYFAAVNTNPLDSSTLIGLFPTTLPVSPSSPRAPQRGVFAESGQPISPRPVKPNLKSRSSLADNHGFIGLSLSCDGIHWSPMVLLIYAYAKFNRTVHQPVDGERAMVPFSRHV